MLGHAECLPKGRLKFANLRGGQFFKGRGSTILAMGLHLLKNYRPP